MEHSVCLMLHLSIYLSNFSGALHNLVAFVQFKKREKHPWRSVNFSKVAGWSQL